MVNLIVSHGSQFQSHTAQNKRTPIHSIVRPSFQAQIRSVEHIHPGDSIPPTKSNCTTSEYHASFPLSSFSTNSPSMAGVGRYRTNLENCGYKNKVERTHDYDSNVTMLYELLESSQWEAAIGRCLRFPEEVRTWIVRQGDSKIRWKVLPLHAAIIFKAPQKVVQSMLKTYPMACSKEDDQGMLPLHLAFRHKVDEGVLQKLLEVYPAGINQKDGKGRIPIDHAGAGAFSGRFVHLYAHAASSPGGKSRSLEERDESIDARLASIEMHDEQRMKRVGSHYDEKMTKLQSEEASHTVTIIPNKPRPSRAEADIQLLRSSLKEANIELQEKIEMLRHSRDNENEVEHKFQTLLENQQALRRLCMKQYHQLEEAQSLNKRMLQSMLDSELDRSAILVSSTDEILTQIASKVEKEGDKTHPIALVEPEENISLGFQRNPNCWARSIAEHGDEISGITDVSQFY